MITNWRVLIIPEGIRLQMKLGHDDLDKLMNRVSPQLRESNLKIKYTFITGKDPESHSDWGERNTRDFITWFGKEKARVSKEVDVSVVPENIVDIIKATTSENIDVIATRDDVNDYEDFSRIIGGDADGAIDILLGSKTIRLVRSSYKSMVKSLQNDHRFHRLSKEGQEQALKRLSDESKMEDAKLILQWADRLEAYKKNRKSDKSPRDKMFNSVLDGLK